jgi:hypothetical protein
MSLKKFNINGLCVEGMWPVRFPITDTSILLTNSLRTNRRNFIATSRIIDALTLLAAQERNTQTH